jgi:hypothetical protein
MSEKSDNFEILICTIQKLLENSDATIEWNAKLSDPDNLKQKRQIDILVTKGNIKNHIECRIHNTKQDVKWIEELIGRKLSLEADNMVAVSSSGFTEGAIKKAKKFGIILKDLTRLTKEEIISWTKTTSLELIYYKVEDLKFLST